MTRYSTPSEFLSKLDSHGIYDARLLDDCDFDTSAVGTVSLATQAAAMEQRGLGGELHGQMTDRTFTGWSAAASLARHYLGEAPGDAFMGRGSSFRANLKALSEGGK